MPQSGAAEPRAGAPSLSQLAHKAAQAWRIGGLHGLVDAAGARVHADLRFVRFHVDLADWPLAPRVTAPDVEVREGRLEEIARYRAGRPGLPLAFWMDVTHGARRFYLALVGGDIGHISWIFTHREHILQMTLAPGEILLDGAHTPAEFRGRGLLSAVERAILDDAKRQGARHAYTHVTVDNVASIRGVTRTGFRPIGILRRRWLLGVPRSRYDDDRRAAEAVVERATAPARRAS